MPLNPKALSQENVEGTLVFHGTRTLKVVFLDDPNWSARPTERMFRSAVWRLTSDGLLRFVPSVEADVRDDLFPLPGVYGFEEGGGYALRCARRSELGAGTSIDGFIQRRGASYQLEVVFAVASMAGRKIARISQELKVGTPSADDLYSISVGSVRVPSVYRLSLTGEADGHAFRPLPGTLSMARSEPEDPNPLLLRLKTDEETGLGSVYATSFLAAVSGPPQTPAMTIEDGDIRVEFCGSEEYGYGLVNPSWTTMHSTPMVPAYPVPAQGNSGTLDFALIGTSVRANLDLSGTCMGSQSRYLAWGDGQATEHFLPGEAFTGAEVDAEQSYVFANHMQIDSFGQITLQTHGNSVTGSYAGRGGGTIEGRIEGSRLSFTWADRAGEQGWGFLRQVGQSSRLVGLWGSGGSARDIRTVVGAAASPVPPALARDVAAGDKDKLKWEGFEAVLQGRIPEAIATLEAARDFYKRERPNDRVWNYLRDSYLIDEINVLTRLTYCYFSERDFDKALRCLEEAVDIRHILVEREYLASVQRSEPMIDRSALTNYVEQWRGLLREDQQKIAALEQAQPFFGKMVEYLLELELEEEALIVSELARARAFADLVASRSSIQKMPSEKATEETLPSLTTVNPVTIQQLRKIAKERNSTIVEYFFTGGKLVVWTISPTGEVRTTVAPASQEEIETYVERFIENVTAVNMSAEDASSHREELSQTLRSLYGQLVQTIDPELLPGRPEEPITIVPHGVLFRLSFGALTSESGASLIEEHALVNSPSIVVL